MKNKNLKINFRYLCGNIACLSVDNIDGEPVHNDINNEEAIIIFNSLVGEKENCQTVKTLLKENKKQKEVIDRIINETKETRNILNNNRDDNILSKSCLLSYLEIVEDLLKEVQE